MTLAGFRSRWTIPFRCAASSADAISTPILRSWASGSGPVGEPLARASRPSSQLHDEEVPRGGRRTRDFFERVDRGDARMVQRGEEPRLPLEPLSSLFTFKELFRQYLDRDLSREARVPRPVDLPHPARTEEREDLVGSELRAGCQGQAGRSLARICPGARLGPIRGPAVGAARAFCAG